MHRSSAWPCFLPLLALACSSSLGSLGQDLPNEGVTAPIPCAAVADPRPTDACPEVSTLPSGTAKAAVDALLRVALAAYGTGARWAGVVAGTGIGRDGKPLATASSGWALAYCDAANVLQFDVTAGICAARNLCDCVVAGTCGGMACDATNDKAFPDVDSDGAIKDAFPEDPVEASYNLSLDVRTGQWAVTRVSDGAVKVVDATTGTIVP